MSQQPIAFLWGDNTVDKGRAAVVIYLDTDSHSLFITKLLRYGLIGEK